MLISIISFATWLNRRDKQWSRQSWALLAFIGLLAIGAPFAANNYWAAWYTKALAITVLAIVFPLQSLLTGVRRLKLWVFTLIGIILYVAAWAASHQGYGPAGAAGAQDENYVATLIGMALPYVYYSLFLDKRTFVRLALLFSIVVFLGALAAEQNPSRGGFISLCVVVLYLLWRSPHKLLGIGVIATGGLVLAVLAGPAYWAEIKTSTDYKDGTGNERLELWKIGARMWKAHPILGVGAGSFFWVSGDYQSQEQLDKVGHSYSGTHVAHSLFIELMAELGSLGVLTLGLAVWYTWSGLGRVQSELSLPGGLSPPSATDSEALRLYADATRASILSVLINGVFLSLLYFSFLYLLLAVGTAIPHIARRIGAPERPPTGRGARSRRPMFAMPRRR